MSIQQIKSGVIADSAITDTKLILTANSSAIKTALNASGDAPIYACRAWVNFNGGATPITIRGSGNVTSITDNGVGLYTVNFTTAMPDANYSAVCSCLTVNGRVGVLSGTQTTSAVLVGQIDPSTGAYADTTVFAVAVFR